MFLRAMVWTFFRVKGIFLEGRSVQPLNGKIKILDKTIIDIPRKIQPIWPVVSEILSYRRSDIVLFRMTDIYNNSIIRTNENESGDLVCSISSWQLGFCNEDTHTHTHSLFRDIVRLITE